MQRVILAILLILGAGCVDVHGGADIEDSLHKEPRPPAQAQELSQNLWLLDGPRPATNAEISGGAEPSMLASKDGKFLWIGDTQGLSLSVDNGSTWEKSPLDFTLSADGWSLAEDDVGNLYVTTTTTVSVVVARSGDGGRTIDHQDELVDFSPVADRPYIAARGDGEVAIIMYDFGRSLSETCVRSTDYGETWMDRSLASGGAIGGNLQFDADGAMVFADGPVMWRYESCTSAIGSSYLNGDKVTMYPQGTGANNHVQVATENGAYYTALGGPANKEIIVAAMDGWKSPVRQLVISPPVLNSNTFAAISVHDGQLAVAWYGSETPGDPSVTTFDGEFNVYVALIDEFWESSPSVRTIRLTSEPNHVGDICMGGVGCGDDADRDLLDYFGVDHDRWGGVHVAYGHDGAGSDRTVRYAQIPASVARAPVEPDGSADQPPVAAFAIAANGLSVRADAGASSDPEGTQLSYVWNWGDGSANDAGKVAFHSYPNFGAFTITLTVTDAAGHTAVATQNVLVEEGERINLLPAADFTASDGLVGETIRFTDRSKDTDGTIVAWAWDFGDGATSDIASPSHSYASPGAKAVSLTVVDDWGESDSQTKTIHITAATTAVNGTEIPQGRDAGQQAPAPGIVLLLGLLFILARRR